MPTITFERAVRDCDYNKRIQRGEATATLIYDFNVVIDGEHRATFKRNVVGVGYRLQDADGRQIKGADTYPVEADKKIDFEDIAATHSAAGRIPTLGQMAALRAEEAAARAKKLEDNKVTVRTFVIGTHAVAMFDELKRLRDAGISGKLVGIINQIEAEADAAAAAVEA